MFTCICLSVSSSTQKAHLITMKQHRLMSIISGQDASLFITGCSAPVMSRGSLRGILSGYLLPQAPKYTDILPKIELTTLHLNALIFLRLSAQTKKMEQGGKGLRHWEQPERVRWLLSFHCVCVEKGIIQCSLEQEPCSPGLSYIACGDHKNQLLGCLMQDHSSVKYLCTMIY